MESQFGIILDYKKMKQLDFPQWYNRHVARRPCWPWTSCATGWAGGLQAPSPLGLWGAQQQSHWTGLEQIHGITGRRRPGQASVKLDFLEACLGTEASPDPLKSPLWCQFLHSPLFFAHFFLFIYLEGVHGQCGKVAHTCFHSELGPAQNDRCGESTRARLAGPRDPGKCCLVVCAVWGPGVGRKSPFRQWDELKTDPQGTGKWKLLITSFPSHKTMGRPHLSPLHPVSKENGSQHVPLIQELMTFSWEQGSTQVLPSQAFALV